MTKATRDENALRQTGGGLLRPTTGRVQLRSGVVPDDECPVTTSGESEGSSK